MRLWYVSSRCAGDVDRGQDGEPMADERTLRGPALWTELLVRQA